jgi:hypothetical protein
LSEVVRGTVINVNLFGAAVRLESGELASAQALDVEAHRAQYERAMTGRKVMDFERRGSGSRAVVTLVPQIRDDDQLEEQIASYLKATHEWETPDQAPAHERHFLRKKKRAERFRPAP